MEARESTVHLTFNPHLQSFIEETMTSAELESFLDRMAAGKLDYSNSIHVLSERGQGVGRMAHGERKYLITGEMVGGGPVTISPVQQGIQQARELNKRARSRSHSHSATRPRKRRKTTKKSRKSKTSSTKRRKPTGKRKTNKKKKTTTRRVQKGKRRRDALG